MYVTDYIAKSIAVVMVYLRSEILTSEPYCNPMISTSIRILSRTVHAKPDSPVPIYVHNSTESYERTHESPQPSKPQSGAPSSQLRRLVTAQDALSLPMCGSARWRDPAGKEARIQIGRIHALIVPDNHCLDDAVAVIRGRVVSLRKLCR